MRLDIPYLLELVFAARGRELWPSHLKTSLSAAWQALPKGQLPVTEEEKDFSQLGAQEGQRLTCLIFPLYNEDSDAQALMQPGQS